MGTQNKVKPHLVSFGMLEEHIISTSDELCVDLIAMRKNKYIHLYLENIQKHYYKTNNYTCQNIFWNNFKPQKYSNQITKQYKPILYLLFSKSFAKKYWDTFIKLQYSSQIHLLYRVKSFNTTQIHAVFEQLKLNDLSNENVIIQFAVIDSLSNSIKLQERKIQKWRNFLNFIGQSELESITGIILDHPFNRTDHYLDYWQYSIQKDIYVNGIVWAKFYYKTKSNNKIVGWIKNLSKSKLPEKDINSLLTQLSKKVDLFVYTDSQIKLYLKTIQLINPGFNRILKFGIKKTLWSSDEIVSQFEIAELIVANAKRIVRDIYQLDERLGCTDFLKYAFVKYEVPDFLLKNAWNFILDPIFKDHFFHICEGKNLSTLFEPLRILKAENHAMLYFSEFFPEKLHFFLEYLLCAKLCTKGITNKEVQTEILKATYRFSYLDHTQIWNCIVDWIARNNEYLELYQIGPLVDFFFQKHHRDPNFTLKNRTLNSAIRQMQSWHMELHYSRYNGNLSWNPTYKTIYNEQYNEIEKGEPNPIFRIIEKTSAISLFQEGNLMHHCVASYLNRCLSGECKILSLEVFEEKWWVPKVTIEVSGNRMIQARGKFNNFPNQSEIEILRLWSKKNGIIYNI